MLIQVKDSVLLSHLSQGSFKEANALCRSLVLQCPDDVDLYLLLGYVFESQQLWRKAKASYQQAITIDPSDYKSYVFLGLLSSLKHDHYLSIDCFEKLMLLQPFNDDLYQTMVEKLISYGENNMADFLSTKTRQMKNLYFSRLSLPEWEYIGDSWPSSSDSFVQGWDVDSVAKVQSLRWKRQIQSVTRLPTLSDDPSESSNYINYGYVLALSALSTKCPTVLDWGGGLGLYGLVGQVLLPSLKVEYYCKDFPVFCEIGREISPNVRFLETDRQALSREYDLVFASSSVHYSQDWKELIGNLIKVSKEYLYICRLPTVEKATSFTFVQRPYSYGYTTEYIGWCINKNELIFELKKAGMILVREFAGYEAPLISGSPEQNRYRGFLFKRT